MIISANEDKNFLNAVYSVAENSPFVCRIISLYQSYGPHLAFVDYWLVKSTDGRCCGAIARNGSVFIVFITDESCVDEVSSFLRVAGASSVLCSAEYPLELNAVKTASGSVLMRCTAFDIADDSIEYCVPDIKSAYELIAGCADDNLTPPKFEDFYVDINHKLRHKTMRMYGIKDSNRLVSVAMTVAESCDGAVLGAVACGKDFRRHGYGSKLVRFMTNILVGENKTVYLHRAENANIAFYDKLGFAEIDKWTEYYFER